MEFLGTDLRSGGPTGPSAFRPRVNSQTSASSITPDIGSYDVHDLTALAANLAINNPTGTPYDCQELVVRIADDGTVRTLSWGSAYRRTVAAALPSTTTPNRIHDVTFRYHAGLSVWVCIDHVVSNALAGNIEYVGGGTAKFEPTSNATRVVNIATIFSGTPLQGGDLLLVGICNCNNWGAAREWTILTSGFSVASQIVHPTQEDFQPELLVAHKFMGGTPDTSFEFTTNWEANQSMAVAVMAFKGVDPSTPLDISPVTASGKDSGVPNGPSATPATAQAMSVVFCGGTRASGTTTFFSSDMTGMLSIFAKAKAYNFGALIGVARKAHTSVSAFDPAAWTGGDSATTCGWCAAHLILRSS